VGASANVGAIRGWIIALGNRNASRYLSSIRMHLDEIATPGTSTIVINRTGRKPVVTRTGEAYDALAEVPHSKCQRTAICPGEAIMKSFFLLMLFGFALVVPAEPQTGQQTPGKDPLTTFLRARYTRDRNFIAGAAEKMPEQFYGMRPGPQTEVRTFGELVGHLANYNFLVCSNVKGEKNPNEGNDFEKLQGKAQLVKALNDAFSYCDSVYGSLTDASAMEPLPAPSQKDAGRPVQLRVNLLIFNYAHNYEHYGNMVTYMRIKSIVPPSSEPGH